MEFLKDYSPDRMPYDRLWFGKVITNQRCIGHQSSMKREATNVNNRPALSHDGVSPRNGDDWRVIHDNVRQFNYLMPIFFSNSEIWFLSGPKS